VIYERIIFYTAQEIQQCFSVLPHTLAFHRQIAHHTLLYVLADFAPLMPVLNPAAAVVGLASGLGEDALGNPVEWKKDLRRPGWRGKRMVRKLPPNIHRLIVALKAEYPPFDLNEIANAVRTCFGRKPDVRSVRRVLDEEAIPLKLEKNYPRYHEMDAYKRRATIVELRVDGWSVRASAGYLDAHRTSIYQALRRFKAEGVAGLADKSSGRPVGVRKVNLAAAPATRERATTRASCPAFSNASTVYRPTRPVPPTTATRMFRTLRFTRRSTSDPRPYVTPSRFQRLAVA
jgi:hypothetical protein